MAADALAFNSSSKCTNEESYLMQKLARAVAGTNNIDNCSRYCQAPATTGLFRTVGYGGDSGSIRDIENAGLVLIIGSNTAESHPVLATRVKRGHKLRGQKLIVSDLRENEMARRADLFLHPKPGTDMVWMSAITLYLLENGMAHGDFLKQWVNGLEEYKKSLAPFSMEFAEKITGLPVETIKKVAHMIADASGVCVLWAMGVTQQSQGSDTSTAISNLLLVTGNYMRTGTGAYPLRGHNNVQGAGDTGSAPGSLPGYQSVNDPEIRAKFEKSWKVKLPSTAGLDNHQMVDAIQQGKVRSLYLIGEEMAIVDSNSNYVGDAFSKLDFMVVQDIFFSTTCRFADVVLPACPSLEKEGTFTSTERRIQRLYQVFEPLSGCRPDWEKIREDRNRPWRELERRPSLGSHGRSCFAYALDGGRDSRTIGRIQDPAVADGSRRELNSAPALHRTIRDPGRQGSIVPLVLDRPATSTHRGVRPASEQRPPARALSRRQPDVSHERNP